jgi:spore maturation protein CgeB
VSTEAGTSFLERNDDTRERVNEYLGKKPKATFEEVFQIFFADYKNPISGKCIASRHFDAIGTKTCQIMFPGRFNDILKADEHYIALNRDFSNINNVLERFLDHSYRQRMVDRAYEYAMDCHTHRHRIDQLLSKVF